MGEWRGDDGEGVDERETAACEGGEGVRRGGWGGDTR